MLWQNRRSVAARYPENVSAGLAVMPTLLASPLLVLLVPIGILGRRWRREHRAAELLLLVLGVFPLALYSFFMIDHRYFVSYLPIYLLWAGAGCCQFLRWWRVSVSSRTRPAMLLLACVLLSLALHCAQVSDARRKSTARVPIDRAVDWRARHGGRRSERILAPSGCSISYYAGNPEATYLPWTDPTGLLRYARHHRYTLLIAPASYLRERRPRLAEILDDPTASGFTEIGRLLGPKADPITLYRIESEPSSALTLRTSRRTGRLPISW